MWIFHLGVVLTSDDVPFYFESVYVCYIYIFFFRIVFYMLYCVNFCIFLVFVIDFYFLFSSLSNFCMLLHINTLLLYTHFFVYVASFLIHISIGCGLWIHIGVAS